MINPLSPFKNPRHLMQSHSKICGEGRLQSGFGLWVVVWGALKHIFLLDKGYVPGCTLFLMSDVM